MDQDTNISGISENLADSISEKQPSESLSERGILKGKKIAISVSESEDLEQLGLSEQHLKDISIEIARYLLINGATMLYGGDLRNGGFTRLYAELSLQYKVLGDNQNRFLNYFPFPNSKTVTLKDKADFVKQHVDARILPPPSHLGEIDMDREYQPFKSVTDRFIFSECFTDMRIIMAKESDARILVGGRQKNFLGFFPGIIEEAFHSLKSNKPLFLLGGFGGATRSLIQAITGDVPKQLSNEFQFDTEFLMTFKDYCKGKSTIQVDYDELIAFFKQYSLHKLSEQNGLTVEENQILFESKNIHELVFLILKGLKQIK